MMSTQSTLRLVTLWKISPTFCLFSWILFLGTIVVAQNAEPKGKEVTLHRSVNPLRGRISTAGTNSQAAHTQDLMPEPPSNETVLFNFVTPSHGAYPATGVTRDSCGNLYGTTNGSYSDIGGGGTSDAGVVFKVDLGGNETVLYSFTGGADGSSPNGLVRDGKGNLYGTTTSGGTFGAGVVFKVDTSGNETVLYAFTGGADGSNPSDVIRDTKGNLYGTTAYGGAWGAGVVFKIDTSGDETPLYTFTGGEDGGYPEGLIEDSRGNLYGSASYGGAAGVGVVFKVDPAGNETVLYAFSGGNDGAYPNVIVRDSQGNLYGSATEGGAAGAGTVFKIDTSGNETTLYSFTGGSDGGFPDSPVAFDPAGNIYGTTNGGGNADLGVVFKVNTAGQETVLHTFARGLDGNQPYLAGVVLDPLGNLYGTTSFGGVGGAGVVYKLNPKGKETVMYSFQGAAPGQYPYEAGVLLGPNGSLYGSTFYGGVNGSGVVYQLDMGRHQSVLYSFDLRTANGFGQTTGPLISDSKGNLYGTTFIGQADAGYGYGVVYKLDTEGHAAVLHNFTGGADGADPYGGVIRDSKGNLYGTANFGGAWGAGVVFKIDTSRNLSVLYNFTGGSDGGYPLDHVTSDASGNLYGTTNGGGVWGAGVVFKVDTSGNETPLYSFTGGADGGSPYGGVVSDAAGNLYGTTSSGGSSGAGVVYMVDTSGNETVLYSFTGGADGGGPLWVDLARDAAGNLYGTTSGGGASGAGVVFKVDASGDETPLYSFTGGADGGIPYAGVILAPNGNLYGTTAFGGQTNTGVVFSVTP